MAPAAFPVEFFISRRGPLSAVAREVDDVLRAAGHSTRVQDYDFPVSGNFEKNMDDALRDCAHLIVVHSADYMQNPHTSDEFTHFRGAAAKSAGTRRTIVLRADAADPGGLMASTVSIDLHSTADKAERQRLILAAARGEPTHRRPEPPPPAAAPPVTLSNISIRIPEHFLGRDDDLKALHTALHRAAGRVAITALHGLRGVGKTVLAAAYAREHASDYRATWWIAAETESTMRADLTALGVRLGWVAEDASQDAALAETMEQLRQAGKDILLIYDNAIDADSLTPYLPIGGAARAT
jgi:hypothetical protein